MTTTEKWRKSNAKAMLKAEIEAGSVTEDSDATAVHGSNPEHDKFKLSNFKQNLKTLLKNHKNPKLPKWGKSEAKIMLRQEIINGTVTDGMDAETVHDSREEFKKHPFKNFKTNLGNLMELILANFERMQLDCELCGHDIALLREMRNDAGVQVPTPWHKSDAKQLLEKEMENNRHVGLTPPEMHQTQAAHREFSLKVFRNHIYQEVARLEKKDHRFAKKKKRMPPARAAEVVVAPIRSKQQKKQK